MIKGFWQNLKTRRLLYRFSLVVGDAFCLGVSLRLAYQTRFKWHAFISAFPVTKGFPNPEIYIPFQWAALGAWMLTFLVAGFYQRINLPSSDEFIRVFRGIFMGWIMILAATFLFRGIEYSRLVMILSALYSFVSVFVFREIVKLLYARVAVKFWEPHIVLVMGSGRMTQSIQHVLSRHPEITMIHKSTREPKELAKFLKDHPIREVFAGEPDLNHKTLIEMSEICDTFDVPFRIVPDILELRMGEVIIDDTFELPTYRVKPITLHGWTYFYKRLFDILCSITMVSAALLPLLGLAYLIRMDSKGPILLKQQRMGFRRRPFPFFKFRSMIENADTFLEELKKKTDRLGPVFKMKNDPRITRVGKWLRKFSLDEIPQILNVLRGDMSLVGPRPQVMWEAAAYDEWARKRLNVLPGISGLWQVSGRAHLSYEEMIELDIFYIEHWSPGLDLKILLKTLPTILGGEGAY